MLFFQTMATTRHGLRSVRSVRSVRAGSASTKGRPEVGGTPATTEGVYARTAAG